MDDVGLLHALVATPSPTGAEAQAVRLLQEQAARDGFQIETDGAGNFIASCGRGERTLLLLGHVDTVPGTPPVRLEGDVLWGRGSVDAKGPLAAFYCAARRHLEHPDLRIAIVGAVDEEGGSAGVRGLDVPTPEWILVGEPSGVDGITLGYKGIIRGTMSFERPVVHGGHPDANACDALVAAWTTISDRLAFGPGATRISGRLDTLHSSSDGFRELAEARFQVRLPHGVPVESIVEPIGNIVSEHAGSMHIEEQLAGVQGDRRGALATALSGALRRAGLTPHPKHKTGTSDWNVVAPRWPDADIAAYGPGDSRLDHAPDERISLQEFRQAVDILDDVIRRLSD